MNPNQPDNQLRPNAANSPSVPPSAPDSYSPVNQPTHNPFAGPMNPIASASSHSSISANNPQTTPSKHHKKRGEGWRSIFSTVLLFAAAIGIALSITAFAFQSFQVDGQSMETTLQNHDRLIVSKIPRTWARITHHPYIPPRGTIIVFNQAGLFDASGNAEKQLIKRVVGLPGDRVVVKDGQITIYNHEHPNGYNPDRTGDYIITASTTPGDVDVTLKAGEIFVCGDNRTNSEDSRFFGPVDANNIIGKLSFRVLPLDKAKKF